MNARSGWRFGVSRCFLGGGLLAMIIIPGLVSRPAWTDVVVSGDLAVDTGTTTTSMIAVIANSARVAPPRIPFSADTIHAGNQRSTHWS